MYLMMDHNEKQYHKFLKLLYYSKVYYLCCCCKNMVIEQLNTLKDNETNNNEEEIDHDKTSIFETRNASIDDQKIVKNGMELSAQTITINEK